MSSDKMDFGDRDHRTLYIAARTGVYKIRTRVAGVRWQAAGLVLAMDLLANRLFRHYRRRVTFEAKCIRNNGAPAKGAVITTAV